VVARACGLRALCNCTLSEIPQDVCAVTYDAELALRLETAFYQSGCAG